MKTFVVEGSTAFPFDMLRYDVCEAATAEDTAKMDQFGLRRIILKMKGRHVPTHKRWESFLWKVVSESRKRK
jgi:hypothetical protein